MKPMKKGREERVSVESRVLIAAGMIIFINYHPCCYFMQITREYFTMPMPRIFGLGSSPKISVAVYGDNLINFCICTKCQIWWLKKPILKQ